MEGGGGTPPVVQDQKKPGLHRVKEETFYTGLMIVQVSVVLKRTVGDSG